MTRERERGYNEKEREKEKNKVWLEKGVHMERIW